MNAAPPRPRWCRLRPTTGRAAFARRSNGWCRDGMHYAAASYPPPAKRWGGPASTFRCEPGWGARCYAQYFPPPPTPPRHSLRSRGEGRLCLGRRTMTAPLLEAEHLVKHFVTRRSVLGRPTAVVKAVDDVSFTVDAGETLALVGESG